MNRRKGLSTAAPRLMIGGNDDENQDSFSRIAYRDAYFFWM